jgi:hypothetical protein
LICNPKTELCCECNPPLWEAFCVITNRPIQHNAVWTEADVVQYVDRFARDNITCEICPPSSLSSH